MSDHVQSGGPEEGYPPLWRNRDFLRFFAGQFVTNAGDSLYTVAILWLVFRLSGSSALVGVANATLLLPFLLQIVAGPIVDRLPVKPLLMGTQFAQGVVVLVPPLAAYAGHLRVGVLLAVVPALALLTLVMSPIRATLMPRIVADDQLSRGNSALATVTLGLDMIFDALGGLFVTLFGATTLFLLDSATFALAGLLFAGMAIPAADTANEEAGASRESEASVVAEYVADLRGGIRVLRGTVFVEMMFTAAVSNFAVGVTLATLPAFGDLLGDAAAYGLLLGALGVGRLVGSASAAYLNGVPYGRLIAAAYSISTALWRGSVYAPSTALTVGLFGLAWISDGIDNVLVSTLNQKVFPPELLGRVSSIKGTVSTATLPVGSLVGGVVAEWVGVTTTMGLAAFGFGFAGLYFALRPSLRRLPAVDDADPTDFDLDADSGRASIGRDGT